VALPVVVAEPETADDVVAELETADDVVADVPMDENMCDAGPMEPITVDDDDDRSEGEIGSEERWAFF